MYIFQIGIRCDDAKKIISEPHGSRTLERTPTQQKEKTSREHRCGADQIPFEGQVRISHNSKVLEWGQLCIPWFVRILEFFIAVKG